MRWNVASGGSEGDERGDERADDWEDEEGEDEEDIEFGGSEAQLRGLELQVE